MTRLGTSQLVTAYNRVTSDCSVKQSCDELTVLCHGSLFVLALVTWMDFKL